MSSKFLLHEEINDVRLIKNLKGDGFFRHLLPLDETSCKQRPRRGVFVSSEAAIAIRTWQVMQDPNLLTFERTGAGASA